MTRNNSREFYENLSSLGSSESEYDTGEYNLYSPISECEQNSFMELSDVSPDTKENLPDAEKHCTINNTKEAEPIRYCKSKYFVSKAKDSGSIWSVREGSKENSDISLNGSETNIYNKLGNYNFVYKNILKKYYEGLKHISKIEDALSDCQANTDNRGSYLPPDNYLFNQHLRSNNNSFNDRITFNISNHHPPGNNQQFTSNPNNESESLENLIYNFEDIRSLPTCQPLPNYQAQNLNNVPLNIGNNVPNYNYVPIENINPRYTEENTLSLGNHAASYYQTANVAFGSSYTLPSNFKTEYLPGWNNVPNYYPMVSGFMRQNHQFFNNGATLNNKSANAPININNTNNLNNINNINKIQKVNNINNFNNFNVLVHHPSFLHQNRNQILDSSKRYYAETERRVPSLPPRHTCRNSSTDSSTSPSFDSLSDPLDLKYLGVNSMPVESGVTPFNQIQNGFDHQRLYNGTESRVNTDYTHLPTMQRYNNRAAIDEWYNCVQHVSQEKASKPSLPPQAYSAQLGTQRETKNVAAEVKSKKKPYPTRTFKTKEATDTLTYWFNRNQHPNDFQLGIIANDIGHDIKTVKIWFHNRRYRVRKASSHYTCE